MRGKAGEAWQKTNQSRITPAYAGKRRCKGLVCHRTQDHPRLCGEKVVDIVYQLQQEGSPPPMRGKAKKPEIASFSPGITPAYAGKSQFLYFAFCNRQDHPRLCGEKTKKIPKQRYFFHQPASFSFSLQYT